MSYQSGDVQSIPGRIARTTRQVAFLLLAAVAGPEAATSGSAGQTPAGDLPFPAPAEAAKGASAGTGPQITKVNYVIGKGPSAKIVNGSPTTWYPSVGALLLRRGRGFQMECTATLIGCSTVLTAAHCIADAADPKDYDMYRMFFQQGGVAEIASIEWQEDQYVSPNKNGAQADIALLRLKQPITGITPALINDSREHAPDLKGTIVGFGRTKGEASDYGMKRFGEVRSAACGDGTDQSELLCWNYRGQDDSNTCDGDSGGPLFLTEGRPTEVISGVTSGGAPDCSTADHSYDTSVFHYSSWISGNAGEKLAPNQCGDAPPLIDKPVRYRSFSGQLDDKNPIHVLEIKLTGVEDLRVAANVGHPIGQQADVLALPKLYVLNGKSRCSDLVGSPAAFCAIEHPTDGVYTIVLNRVNDRGLANFQLVLSVF